MKYIPSIAFEEMSGSAKGVTAAKVRGRKYIRNRGYGGGFKTAAQSGVKAVFKQLAKGWRGFTNAQILAWNALANTQKGKSVLGTSSRISGANLYSRLNFWVVKSGNEPLSAPPVLNGVDAPCEADLSLTADTFTFQLPAPPEGEGRPQAHHHGFRPAEPRRYQGLQQGRDDRLAESNRR